MVIVAGPAGSGKSTIGSALATALGADFFDADGLHSLASVEKMRSGQPLDDDDRRPWLNAVRALIDERRAAGLPTVVAVSALRRPHRAALGAGTPGTRLVWLTAPADVLAARLANRPGHFFPAHLLDSQLATAQPPAEGENAATVDASRPVADVVDAILAALGSNA